MLHGCEILCVGEGCHALPHSRFSLKLPESFIAGGCDGPPRHGVWVWIPNCVIRAVAGLHLLYIPMSAWQAYPHQAPLCNFCNTAQDAGLGQSRLSRLQSAPLLIPHRLCEVPLLSVLFCFLVCLVFLVSLLIILPVEMKRKWTCCDDWMPNQLAIIRHAYRIVETCRCCNAAINLHSGLPLRP